MLQIVFWSFRIYSFKTNNLTVRSDCGPKIAPSLKQVKLYSDINQNDTPENFIIFDHDFQLVPGVSFIRKEFYQKIEN